MAATLKDIARLSGVSTATVSKIINGKDHDIGENTIKRVRLIIDEQNFRPNYLARSMRTKVTRTIGLIIPDVRNPYFTDMARGAEDSAQKRGYSLLFCNSDDDLHKEIEYIKTLTERQVDGIALAGSVRRDRALEERYEVEVPMVTLDRDAYFKGVRSYLQVDNISGAHDAVCYLVRLGHKRILFLSGERDAKVSEERLEGYQKALAEAGIPFDESLVQEGSFNLEFGHDYILSGKLDPTVTAIFCGNDLIALGALKGLKKVGKRVPEDISVIGFDDIHLASIWSPELTTVRQPIYDLGYTAVGRLIDILEGVEHTEKMEIKLELIVRESTGPVPD